MLRITLILTLCWLPAAAQLADCPDASTVTGFEQGFSVDFPASLVDSDVSAAQVILTTRTGTSRAAIVTALDGLAADANPERRIKLLDTAGSAIAFCQSSITVNSSSELTMGFKLNLDAADGGRACLYIDTDQSESSDLSDCTTSGGYSGWDVFNLAGSLTDWSGNSRALTIPSTTPTTGTEGPLGHSAVIDSAGSESYYAVSNTGAATLESATFTAFFAGAGDSGTANGGNTWVLWRNPNDSLGTLSLRWFGGSSVWGHMVFPRQGASSGWTEFGPVGAGVDFSIVCTREAEVGMACHRNGAGLVESVALVSSTFTAATGNFIIGTDELGNTWDGEFHAWGFIKDTAWAAARAKVINEITNDQDNWTVTALEAAAVVRNRIRRGGYVQVMATWEVAPASATAACDQVNAALGWDPGQSTPTGNQFVICSPEGERMKTGFSAQ